MSNLFNFSAWATSIIEVRRGTYSVSGESITITATSDDAYTYPDRSSTGGYEIPIPSNCENIKLSWLSNNDANGDVFIFGNGDVTNIYSVDNAETKELIVANNKWSKITVRFGVKYSGESITYSAISLEVTYSWHIVDGQITNGNFIPMPELYDTQPDALWRIEDNNLFNKLMPQNTYLGAFANATQLRRISIPKSCKKIGRYSFRNTKLTAVTIASDCVYYDTSFPAGCVVNFYPD